MGCNKSSKSLKMIMVCYAKFLAVAMWVHSVAGEIQTQRALRGQTLVVPSH